MRFHEDFFHRIQETAKAELGHTVTFDKTPLAVRNVIRKCNNVAILFRCYLPDDYQIDNGGKNENDNGYLKWFSHLPEDFLEIQHVFDDILEQWK